VGICKFFGAIVPPPVKKDGWNKQHSSKQVEFIAKSVYSTCSHDLSTVNALMATNRLNTSKAGTACKISIIIRIIGIFISRNSNDVDLLATVTKSSSTADGLRDALCQLKSCQLQKQVVEQIHNKSK